ncbi:MAG: NAD-binding protein [Rubrivivax sp.]
MGIDFTVVREHPFVVAAIVFGLLAVKAAVLTVMARAMPVPLAESPVFVSLLAQGGEFGFVVLQTAQGAGVIGAAPASLLTAAIALSMLATPLLLLMADRWWLPHIARHTAAAAGAPQEIAEPQRAPILIAGFGRYEQIIGRLLAANGMEATVLEHSAEQVEGLRRFGWKAFYGDATRLDLLRIAGAAEARIFVLAIDDVEQSVQCATLVREHFPQCTIVARARNAAHYARLRQLGLVYVERETLDSSLMSGRTVLELAGMRAHEARTQALRFRRHSVELLEEMVPHLADENRLIAIAKQGRQQPEETWARERAQHRTARPGALDAWNRPGHD